MWGTVGRIWRRTCDQFWGSLKKTSLRQKRGLLRTEKGENEVAQQLVNDSRRKKESLTNEKTLVRRRMRGENGREKKKGLQ
jgi:hypothetical protein